MWRTQEDNVICVNQLTLPNGNFFKNSTDLLVSPNTKLGAIFKFAPENWAAIKALKALKFSG